MTVEKLFSTQSANRMITQIPCVHEQLEKHKTITNIRNHFQCKKTIWHHEFMECW